MASVSGGEKANKVLREILARLEKPGTLEVGFLANAKYPDGTQVAMVAAIHNYGKWPFFSNTVRDKSPEWPAALGKVLVATDYDAERSLGMMGEGIKGQVQKSIRDMVDPPLAPSTVARKGFDKPLIETSHMLNSVDYAVNK